MNIPIIPGPFSFLASAGEALGKIGEEREKDRQQAMKEAGDRLSAILKLVSQGRYDPGILESPDVVRDLGVLGLPKASGKPTGDDLLVRGKREAVQGLELTGMRIATGLPTEETEQRARISGEALTGVSGDTPQGRAVAQVPSAPAATAAEQATIRQAEIAERKSVLDKELMVGVTEMLTELDEKGQPKNKEMVMLAREAVLGLLPYRIAQLQTDRANLTLERQAAAANLQVLLTALKDIPDLARRAQEQWRSNLEIAAFREGVSQDDKKAWTTFMETYSVGNPMPTPTAVRDEYLQSMLGIDFKEYQSRIQQLMNQVYGIKEKVNVNVPVPRKPCTSEARPEGKTKLDLAVEAAKAGAANPEAVIAQLAESAKRGEWSALQVRSILARAGLIETPAAQQLLKDLGEK